MFTSAPIAVNGNGAYGPSGAYTPTVPGTYRWRASYSGDAANNAVTGACGAENETVVIAQATPTVATAASAGGALGVALTDTATVTGGSSPTGTVTFNLYGPNDATCATTRVFTSTVALSAGSATSGSFTPTAIGTYRWTATYNGDAANAPVTHPCNAPNESATIVAATPTVATVASAGGPVGTSLSDVATVSGGANPTGTVTFTLYGPNDASCSGTPVFTSTVALAGGSATSASFTPTAAGVYRWTAQYSGDANHNAVAHPCNAPNESATISPATIVLTTQTAPLATLGTSIADTATLTGGVNPTGTLTFTLYGPNDATCSGAPRFTSSPVVVNGNGTYTSSPPFTPTTAGDYRWIALYSGDANHAAVSGACNDANELVTVTTAAPPPGGPEVPVPTLSPVSLALLALGIGLATLIAGRRRRGRG